MPIITTSIQHCIPSPNQDIWQEKEIKGLRISKEEQKCHYLQVLSLFSYKSPGDFPYQTLRFAIKPCLRQCENGDRAD